MLSNTAQKVTWKGRGHAVASIHWPPCSRRPPSGLRRPLPPPIRKYMTLEERSKARSKSAEHGHRSKIHSSCNSVLSISSCIHSHLWYGTSVRGPGERVGRLEKRIVTLAPQARRPGRDEVVPASGVGRDPEATSGGTRSPAAGETASAQELVLAAGAPDSAELRTSGRRT